MADIHADIDALRALRDGLIRFRQTQRDVSARGDQEIEKTRASLAAKASKWQATLDRRRADLAACQRAAAAAAAAAARGPYGLPGHGRPGYGHSGYAPDCSKLARAVQEAQERLKHIKEWQRKIEQEAAAFRNSANRFRDLIEYQVPSAERHLLAIANGLESARGIQTPGSRPTPGR